MDKTGDHTEPVSKADIAQAINEFGVGKLDQYVDRILGALNEKRDSYNGVVSSMIYLIESNDGPTVGRLRDGLLVYLTQRPMSFAGKTFLTKALYRLIEEQPCFVQDSFEYFLGSCDNWKRKFLDEETQVLKIQIIALKAIKQAEQSSLGRATTLSSDFIERLCMISINKGDDATKIDTLSLVLESRSTTKVLDDRELNIYRTIFRDALCLQDPALRQIFISLTNKLLKRLKDSYKVVLRDRIKFNDTDREDIMNKYRRFIEWLIQTCLDSNYCNAYFGSFVLSISTLKLIILHITFTEDGLPIKPQLSSRRCFDSILSCLSDSFEENKILALSLLLSLPYNDIFFSDANIKVFESIAYNLIDSINPAHSLTCQYVFKLLVGLEEKKAHAMNRTEISKNRVLLRHLNNLIDQVEGSIESAQDNFTLALKGKPVYPKLTCIRSLLEEAEISDLESDRQHWLKLCHKVVRVSIEACKAVSTIVCNLNPETIGHLPMDLKPVDPESLAKSFNLSITTSDIEYSTISSQMLLISGWKTIKECSLSLGTLCVRFWWPKDGIKIKKEKFRGLKTEPVLARDDIKEILDYFDHYLRNLRHRGAFEQAYNGFIMVTRRIWHDAYFREQLIKSLHEIMSDFKLDNPIGADKADHLKAYVTRRSAGLPFIVQAILISEHKQESETLDWTINSLFEVLKSEKSEEYQRIHCMNILKALIKEHNLGEKVLKHVGETLSITLKAFRSDSFPIRNCANMLLKAVVDRTFGVNRLKEEIHRRNQLSFEKIFSEVPSLFPELIEYLKTDVNDKKYLPSIHSVLIVLSRLKASTSPSSNYTFDKVIEPFIDLAMKWALLCPDYKLREVAAKICIQLCNYSTVQTSPPVNIDNVGNYLFSKLASRVGKANYSHGRLASIRFLIESDSRLFHRLKDSIWKILEEEVAVFGKHSHNSSWKLNFINAIECWSRVMPLDVSKSKSLSNDSRLYLHNCIHDGHPHRELAVFKLLSFKLIECVIGSFCISSEDDQNNYSKICTGKDFDLTLNAQAAYIRLLRQLYCCDQDIVDELHSVLDLDSTATFQTPFDELKYRKDEGLECAKLEAHLNRQGPTGGYRDYFNLYFQRVTDFSQFDEFKPLVDDAMASKFSAKTSNTPRSIELLAYAYKTRGFKDLGGSIIWQKPYETEKEKLGFLREFISSLTDCDVKSLAVILAGQMLLQVSPDSQNIDEIELFSELINELADDDHSFVVRKACCHFLKLTFNRLMEQKANVQTSSLVNFISAIIKLTKDSESELRSLSFKVVSSLDELVGLQSEPLDLCGSRLDPLIRLIVDGSIFDADDVRHSNQLLELLCQIIFDHGKNYSHESEDDKERLFDKTKLNTFADHVAATKSALRGLYRFFERREQSVDLDTLKLPSDVFAELDSGLKLTKPSISNSTGDYSWRLRQFGSLKISTETESRVYSNQVINRLLQEIVDSFEYFSRGYWNILTDTEYIYHELSLYRRIAFVKFITDRVEHNPRSESSLCEIKTKLQKIVSDSCATTILTKCIDLLNCDQIISC